MKTLFLFVFICLISSCESTKKNTASVTKNNTIKRKWMVVKLNTIDKKTLVKHKVFIDLSGNENTGIAFAGCNNIQFTYKVTSNSINFSDVISTRMYCEDTNNIESSLLNALNTCKEFKTEGQFLYLTTTSNSTIKCVAEDWD